VGVSLGVRAEGASPLAVREGPWSNSDEEVEFEEADEEQPEIPVTEWL